MTSDASTVHSDFVPVCRLEDLDLDEPARHDVGEVPVAVVRTSEGVFAVLDICSHGDVALSEGDVDDCHLECWMHGSRFDLRTGIPDSPPAVLPIPTYPVRIEGTGADAVVLIALPS